MSIGISVWGGCRDGCRGGCRDGCRDGCRVVVGVGVWM